MAPFITRCFLLLLLVCDWAGDPYHGTSPLSQSRSSQTYCCHSIGPQAEITIRLFGMFPLIGALLASDVLPSLPSSSWLTAEPIPSRPPASGLLYVLMSLQR